jgi:nucleotide-binding universal stress UspA family protein
MFGHILVPLDGSSLAESALPHAVALAQSFESEVTLVRVVERVTDATRNQAIDPLNWKMRTSEAEAYLDEVGGPLRAVGVHIDRTLLEGKPAERIIEFVRGQDIDLIVLSSHGQGGLSQWNINSTVQKVVMQAYVPTLIVRAYQPAVSGLGELRYQRLMVPLDGSQRAEAALSLAVALARSQQASLVLAHVISKPEVPRRVPLTEEEAGLIERFVELNRKVATRYLSGLETQFTMDIETRLLVAGDTTAALHQLVEEEEVDLVVLSAHGYSGEARWPFGSVALNFIAFGSTPLLIVHDMPKEEVETSAAEKAAGEEAGH